MALPDYPTPANKASAADTSPQSGTGEDAACASPQRQQHQQHQPTAYPGKSSHGRSSSKFPSADGVVDALPRVVHHRAC